MAGRPPRPGPRPPSSSQPRIGAVGPARREARNPFRPDEDTGEDDLGPLGKSGRGIPGAAPPPSSQPPPSNPGEADGASPFAAFAPDSRVMNEHAARARSQSLGVVAIVGGLAFMVGAAVVITLVVLVALFVARDEIGEVIAGKDEKDPQHITDTGFVREIEKPQPGGGGGAGAGPSGDPDDPSRIRDPRLGPPPGPATVIVSTDMFFHTIEVDCPGGYRNRGKFRKDPGGVTMRATVRDVPGDEKCTVTFQGSEPAKTYVSGNQTKQCTFQPTKCDLVW